jgi:hypothetical protein
MMGIPLKAWGQAAITLFVIWAFFGIVFSAFPNLVAR